MTKFQDLESSTDLNYTHHQENENSEVANTLENSIQLIKERINNENIELHLDSQNKSEMHFSFSIEGTPICGHTVKTIIRPNLSIYLVGYIPDAEFYPEKKENYDETLNFLQNYFNNEINMLKSSKCLFIHNKEAISVWNFKVEKGSHYYEVWADESNIYLNAPLNMDLKIQMGQLFAFSEGPQLTPLKVFEMPVDSGGTLTNFFFVTDTTHNPSNSVPRAIEPSLEFFYETQDPRFQEVSTFVHAMRIRSFFETLGYTEYSKESMVLSLHNEFNRSPNNASYYPKSVSPYDRPAILFGDGDGINFGNFAIDPDVITHEYSHHVIYQYLNPTREESLILHEGLSDFFAEARTGDPCLARSICLSESSGCFSKCLRTAKNSIQFNDSLYTTSAAHLKSLVISGLLWDLKEKIGTNVHSIVFSSLKYLVFNSGFKHYISAMLLADQDLYNGSHACTILDIVNARGFDSFTSNLNCKDYSTINSNKPTLTNSDAQTSKKKSRKCGMVVGGTNINPWYLYPSFLIPLLFLCFFLNLRLKKF